MAIQHPNLLTLLDYDYDGVYFYTIYESQSDYKPLSDRLQNASKWRSEDLFKVVKQVIEAAALMESNGLLMGQINLNTVLVNSTMDVKCSHALLPSLILHRYIDAFDVLEDGLFYAPEYLQKQPITGQADVYSIGILMYFLYTTKWPYNTSMTISKIKKAFLKTPITAKKANSNISDPLNALIMNTIAISPAERVSSVNQLKRLYLGEIDAASISNPKEPSKEIETQIVREIRKRRGKKAVELSIVSVAIIIPILLLMGLYSIYINYLTEIPKVDVPDVIGLRFEAAESVLNHHKLRVKKAGDRTTHLYRKGM